MVLDKTAPVISDVTVTPDSKKITINYTANDPESGIDQVKCYYKKSSDSEYVSVDTSNGICEITGLLVKTDYDYKIEAINGDGLSTVTNGTTKTLEGACKVTQQTGSSLALGDTITCGTEAFYYIGEEGEYIKLFTKNPLSSSNTQVSSGYVTIEFKNSSYWTDGNGNLKSNYGTSYPAYVYDSNSLLYPYVESYVSKINGILKVNTVKGRLANLTEIQNTFGCSRFASSSSQCTNGSKYNLGISDFWFGTAQSSGDVHLYLRSGNYATYGGGSRAIRPVILIPKSEL